MTQPTASHSPVANDSDRVIVALDVESADDARSIIDELRGEVGAFKIGLQLFAAAGPGFVREIAATGTRVFLDLKFHDIPNTVAKASVEAARLGVWMFNVHTAGGSEMMRRAAAAVDDVSERQNIARALVIGVTVLTSSDASNLAETGIKDTVEGQVGRLARLAADSGLDGVVASPLEVGIVKSGVQRSDFVTVTPGIRPASATADDQKRVTTIREALANGSDYVVIGRPIIAAADRKAALRQILAECE